MFGEFKRLRIVALAAEGYRAPTITKKLADENLKASRQGISKFLMHLHLHYRPKLHLLQLLTSSSLSPKTPNKTFSNFKVSCSQYHTSVD